MSGQLDLSPIFGKILLVKRIKRVGLDSKFGELGKISM